MKFHWLFLFVLTGIFAACGSSEDDENQLENNFSIQGKINGAANQTIKVEAQTDRGVVTICETTADASGTYQLEGNIPAMGIYSMTVGRDARNTIILPLNVNDNANVSGNLEEFSIYPHISGTTWAKPLMSYMKKLNDFSTKYMLPENAEKLTEEQRIKGREQFISEVRQMIVKDPSNTANIVMVSALFPSPEEGFATYDKANIAALEKMSAAFQQKYPDSPLTAALSQNIGGILQEYDNFNASTGGTMAAPDISLPNPDGKQMRLSDLKGKVVLVDFWASWCGPCRKENPNVVRLYNKYKNKGFDVFSVSLDQDKQAWKQAIAKDGLVWKNHVSDLMGWQTPLMQQYGFNAIPYTVLLNKEGKIIGIGLRGEQLEQKLEEVLGKN